ncbi:hypothetical protein [Selenomonas ruminantium]|nr:hypothetical protein [Selenomonas ruminantium]
MAEATTSMDIRDGSRGERTVPAAVQVAEVGYDGISMLMIEYQKNTMTIS